MPAFDPASLAAWTGGVWTGPVSGPVEGFCADSRCVGPGQVFVALKTDRRDGHAFVRAAAEAGAAGAVVAHADPGAGIAQLVTADPLAALQAIAREHRRIFSGPVAAVSGSAGKTSTKDLLAVLLGGSSVLATEGNLNNHIGVPLTLTRLDGERHASAVVEAGISAPGEMAVLASMIRPDLAIITLVAAAHLKELGGLEGVAREKAALPEAMQPGGVALFHADCCAYAPFRHLEEAGRALVLERAEAGAGMGAGPAATATASVGAALSGAGRLRHSVEQTEEATIIRFYAREVPLLGTPAASGAASGAASETARSPVPVGEFRLRRVSNGMAANAALAITAAVRLGISEAAIRVRLADWAPAALRGEWRREGDRLLYVDCYNANPAAMADALETFCALAPARQPRLFVVGCMEELGAESPRYHRELGRTLGQRIGGRPGDGILVVGGQADDVRSGAAESGLPAGRIEILESGEGAGERVGAFRGSVFLKGSRRYGLERALDPAAAVH